MHMHTKGFLDLLSQFLFLGFVGPMYAGVHLILVPFNIERDRQSISALHSVAQYQI